MRLRIIWSKLRLAFGGRPHLSDRNPARRLESPSDELSSVPLVQAFGSVIGLLRPRCFFFLDQLQARPVDYVQLTATCPEDDQGRPP